MIQKFLIPLLIFGVFVGYRFYQSNQTKSETKTLIIAACAGDEECVRQVNLHFEGCFDDNYISRRRYTRLNTEGLANCLNTKAGTPFFSVSN